MAHSWPLPGSFHLHFILFPFIFGMRMRQGHRKIAAWIACFAVLLSSLAPSISHALAATKMLDLSLVQSMAQAMTSATNTAEASAAQLHEAQLHELCITNRDGVPASVLEPFSSAASTPHSHGDANFHFEHCPFCFTHAGSFGLATDTGLIIPQANGASILPELFYHSPAPLFAWASPLPRAPPFFS